MSLLNNLNSAAKGASVTITLDKSALFALAPVAADPDFSVQANVVRAEVIFRSSVGGQKKRVFFDLTQSTPSAQLAFSNSAKDSFLLSKIILRSADDMIFAVIGSDLPSGNDVTFIQIPPSFSPTMMFNFEASPIVDIINASASSVTLLGNATRYTGDAKFGSASLQLNKSPDAVKVVYPSNVYTGGDFTFECWIKSSDYSNQEGSFTTTIAHLNSNGSPGGIHIQTRENGRVAIDNGMAAGAVSTNPVFTNDTWQHLAVVKMGTLICAYVDGVMVISDSAQIYPSCNELLFGEYMESADRHVVGGFMGLIDNVRFVDGYALYTGNFTVPSDFTP